MNCLKPKRIKNHVVRKEVGKHIITKYHQMAIVVFDHWKPLAMESDFEGSETLKKCRNSKQLLKAWGATEIERCYKVIDEYNQKQERLNS